MDRIEMLTKMVEGGSTDPFHHYALAMEYRSRGKLDEALVRFSGIRSRFPEYVPTYLMAGQVAIELSKLDDARGWLTKGIEVAKSAGDEHARSELQTALAEIDTEEQNSES